MKQSLISTILALAIAGAATAQEKKAEEKRPAIDLVFCIDCSGSMKQIIESAKQKIWSVVNEVARARPVPTLRIGLIGYGKKSEWIRMYDLTDDLDKVYENLMTFKVERMGDEWVGWAIHKATTEMDWAEGPDALKIIFVAGNETARQGPEEFDLARTAPAAIEKDIIVNAIFCGNFPQDVQDTWREFARLAEGSFTAIDISGGVVSIPTPHDKEIAALNTKLNATYIPYGKRGRDSKQRQEGQDKNAQSHGGAGNAAERAASKAGPLYRNASWDLVDASDQKDFKLEDVKEEDLPEKMRKMTLKERKEYIAKNKAERVQVQKEIQTASQKRRKFVEAEMKKRKLDADTSFDKVIRETVRKQAARKNFKFDE